MESAITKIICANNGSMNLDELTANFSSLNLNTKKDRFCVAVLDGEKTVIAKTSVRVCKDRACGGCRNLHLCKRYLLGDCKFGARCCFGHDHTTGPNASVLEQHGLELLDKDELCTLLLQNDNSLLPPVCRDFNNGRCSEEDSCWRLHVCERYLRGGCSCARGHDLHQAQPMSALRARGIPSHLICRVKSVYVNAEALRTQERPGRAGGRQQQTSSDSATPGASKGPASNSRGEQGESEVRRVVRYPDSHQLFVGNVPHDVDKGELKEFFEQYGTVIELRIKCGGKLPNFGFVVFEDAEPVQKILNSRPIKFRGDVHLNAEEKKTRSAPEGDRRDIRPRGPGGPGGRGERIGGPRGPPGRGGMAQKPSFGSGHGSGPSEGRYGGPRQ